MIYGIAFGEKHSFDEWRFFLNGRPVISPPVPKSNFIDIPGSDGSIDLTESLTGGVAYERRTISFAFLTVKARKNWSSIYSGFLDYLHGQQMKIILDEDPDYYYMGRVSVNEWKSDIKHSIISVEANVEPYKYELFSSLEDWEWDSFNFETGIIREYKDLEVDGTLELEITGRRMSVVPSFIVASTGGNGLQVTYNDVTYNLIDGANRVLNIVLKEGTNTLHFAGNGTVSIDYRGGRL